MKKIILYIFLLIALPSFSQSALTILHTNDTHSRLEPFKENGEWIGGSLRRMEYLQQVRSEQNDVLLVDAGDYSQGTPYFNLFGGYVEVELMNQMGYDAATLGNHEFDNGLNALADRLRKAKFKTVCANYSFHHKDLDTLIKPYIIIEKGEKKIGIFGLLTDLDGLIADPAILDTITYLDPIESSKKVVEYLRNTEQCNLIICLSHLGLEPERADKPMCDKLLAKKVDGIDIIIGGHSHTYLSEPLLINSTSIMQMGTKGGKIGRIDWHF